MDNDTNTSSKATMDTSPLTMGQYLLLFLIFVLPFVNLILIPKWAFGRRGNINRRNYARACLVVYGFGIIIELIVFFYMTRISGY